MKIVSRQESQKIINVSGEPNIQVDSPFGETSTDPKLFFVTISSYLSNSKPDEVLMFTDNSMIELSDTEEAIYKTWKRFDSEIVFAATSDFDYKSKALQYFYWKFYPRQKSFYDFLDARLFVGRASDLLDMVNDIISNYDLKGAFAINDLFHRIYVDTQTGLVKAKYKITLDHLHMLAGSVGGRVAFFRWPLISKTHSILFFKEEEKMLKPYQRGAQNKARDYQEQKLRRFNKKTNTFPAVFIGKEKEKLGRPLFGWMLSLAAYLKTLHLLLVITIFNKGVISQEKIFRYSQNKGKEVNESISGIIQLLRIKQPFSFSHFNDGEMTFIKKYLKKDHKEVWFGGTLFGRFQDQYNEKLGKLLVDSFEMQQEHYFIGTPCKACHPRLHAFASEARKSDAYTIPAMTFHHNLSYYPEILGLIKERKTYFVVNPYQNLSFFKDIGFTIGYDQHIKVPFKNAHHKFENLKELRFDEGSVVFLMCGMLAKVLCAHWYKHQPNVTFIAFGSSFDDLIQENINFGLFPKEYPFSRNILGSRGYLFGAKQKCPVCFDLNNSATEIS